MAVRRRDREKPVVRVVFGKEEEVVCEEEEDRRKKSKEMPRSGATARGEAGLVLVRRGVEARGERTGGETIGDGGIVRRGGGEGAVRGIRDLVVHRD